MPLANIDDLNDERLLPFRDMRNRNWTELSGLFIAEGPLLVERLVASDYEVHSVLLDQKYVAHYAAGLPDDCPVLVVPHELVEQIVGFNFHRGILGCGRRKPERQVMTTMAPESLTPTTTIMAVVGVQDPENLGGMLRICAGLGIQHVLIGPGTADPLSRRVLRVSMGNAFRLQLFRARDIVADLQWLRSVAGVESIATSLGEASQPLERIDRHGPLVILMGNEKQGLPDEVLQAADRQVRIDMQLGTDSLNVTVAAGIIAHYFCRLAPQTVV